MDKIKNISDRIIQQLTLEREIGTSDRSIGYLEGEVNKNVVRKWILRNEKQMGATIVRDIKGNPIDTTAGNQDTIYTRNNTVCRDSKFGRIISQGVGTHDYDAPAGRLTAVIELLSTYVNSDNHGGDAINGVIQFNNGMPEYRFSSLYKQLLELKELEDNRDNIAGKLNTLEKDSEAAKELLERIEQEEFKISELKKKVRKHIAQEVQLRDQPILDKYQEDIKRSKILNGALVINGGPGTGKTTALIQRITYLTAPTIMEETGELNQEQKSILFDQNASWVFYSPTDLLRNYLSNAMIAEGLTPGPERVRTWNNHRKVLLRETQLINTDTKRPFVNKNSDQSYYKNGSDTFNLLDELFIQSLLDRQESKIKKMHDEEVFKRLMKEINFPAADKIRSQLKDDAVKFKNSSMHALRFNNLSQWIPFFISFQKEFSDFLKDFNNNLTSDLNREAARLQVVIGNQQETIDWLKKLVIDEYQQINFPTDDVDEEELDELEEENFDLSQTFDVTRAINSRLKSLLRSMSIRSIDAANNKLSYKNRILLERLEGKLIPEVLHSLGIRLYFKKYFEKPAKGLEANLLAEIPTTYKQFRRQILKGDLELLSPAGIELCEKAIKNENKSLYSDEADYLLASIFNICKTLYKSQNQYFNTSKHPYIFTYRNNIKGVVAIDEATDFSLWELIAMSRLAHPIFESVTLSGDLMQRLTQKGISSWADYSNINKNSEVRDLKIAYRQTAKLLKIASEIYSWNVNMPADFKAHYPDDPLDPDPLVCISDNEDEKMRWLIDRIMEIQNLYGSNFPTVAIFVKDDAEVVKVAARLNASEQLEESGIETSACVNGQILGDRQNVRVFSVEYIKGLEFGAVFFLDIDRLENVSEELINKYIYVGLSRANLFLAITLNDEFSDGLEYLKPHFKNDNWKEFKEN